MKPLRRHGHIAYARRVQRAPLTALALALPLVVSSCDDAGPTKCSGHAELCDRSFDQVAFPATHNSMANTDENRAAANQTHNIARQLDDGIRGLMLDTHYVPTTPPTVMLCHGICFADDQTLEDGLGVIRRFLDSHPGEIVTIIFESYVSKEDTAAAFAASGAMRYVYAHPLGTPWPTLREMIDADHRLVVFTDSDATNGSDGFEWYMDQWAEGFQNPYAAKTAADFSCAVDRGSGSNPIFIMNHFLTDPVGMMSFAEMVNPYPVLSPHVTTCRTERARIPNFVTVDFYEVGDLFRVVDELNGFGATP